MQELASLAESYRKITLDRYRILKATSGRWESISRGLECRESRGAWPATRNSILASDLSMNSAHSTFQKCAGSLTKRWTPPGVGLPEMDSEAIFSHAGS